MFFGSVGAELPKAELIIRRMIARFYCPPESLPLETGRTLLLPDSVAHHALKVLRLRAGVAIVLFDGQGREAAGRIVRADRQCEVMLENLAAPERESPLPLTLIQGLPGGDKMDWVVQKAVELGVKSIQPVQTGRSLLKLSGERLVKRVTHWQQVAVAACEQSGRNWLPAVQAPLDLTACLACLATTSSTEKPSPLRLLLSPHQGVKLSRLPQALPSLPSPVSPAASTTPRPSVQLMVGPEGGFSEAEEAQIIAAGFQAVTLGPRVLRTETAGLAAVAACQVLWGDF